MSSGARLLLFDAAHEPSAALRARLAAQGFSPQRLDMAGADDALTWTLPDIAVVVTGERLDTTAAERTAAVLARLITEQVATVVWGAADGIRWTGGALVEWLDPGVTLDEVVGRLCALARYVPLVRQLGRELDHIHRLGDQLNRYFAEIDQEMRLAGRLQRDFLPRKLPELPGVRFGALYRPASWVSGDLYDAFRIDDQHIGIFIADAMGHGVAAGLLTMFLRQALVPRLERADAGAVISPADAMTRLHECLVRQKLPNCQFVTAVYGVLHSETRELTLARGGHPHPLLVRSDGRIEPIAANGSLLGLPDLPGEFDEVRLPLRPGEKVVLYTDGLEEDFLEKRQEHGRSPGFTPELRGWARLGVLDMVAALDAHLDGKEGSLHPADDMTLLALEATQQVGTTQ